MTLALLQPHFAPDLHDLALMLQADEIWLQTGEVWSRKGRIHRARIRTPDGFAWLNLPVRTEDRNNVIDRVRIDQSVQWVDRFKKTLYYNYRNSFYYDYYRPEIESDFERAAAKERLIDAVRFLRHQLFGYLQLDRDLIPKEKQTGRYLPPGANPDEWASSLGATRLLQEHDSRHYQRQADMRSDPGVEHPVYRQHFDGFEPWCCLYDLLFQYGPEAMDVWSRLLPTRTH
ncbi:MAG: WbqC family protein [Balneolaceae bacterium]